MVTGGSSSGVAVAVQSLCQEQGIIFMAGLTHSNDTTGKDKRRYGFRHFFNAYMSGAALAPVLNKEYGGDRRAYHLTADYTWGWTQEESIKNSTEALGTTNWNWSLQDEGSQAFVQSFGAEYGAPPSMAAHTCYVQTLLYANACEMAGTFYPPEVIKQLEGFNFDGMGNGPTLYRAEDHQCFKDVLVVRGNDNPSSQFDLLKVVDVTPRAQVEYDWTIFGGELGPYEVKM